MGNAAIIGGSGAGKTTFACMCDSLSDGIMANGLTKYFEERKEGFKLRNELPGAVEAKNSVKKAGYTPRPEWDFVKVEQETLFRGWNISYVDCAGELQTEILEKLLDLAEPKMMGSRSKEDPFSKILGEILSNENRKLREYVKANINRPIFEWGKRLKIEDEKSKEYIERDRDDSIPKILFLKALKDADRLIFTINGEHLKDYWIWTRGHEGLSDKERKEKEDSISALYNQLKAYSAILNFKRNAVNKVAIMITKSYKFGVTKTQKQYEKELLEKFEEFLENVSRLKEELRWTHRGIFCVGVPGVQGKEEIEHEGVDKIFGVKELINWLFPLI